MTSILKKGEREAQRERERVRVAKDKKLLDIWDDDSSGDKDLPRY